MVTFLVRFRLVFGTLPLAAVRKVNLEGEAEEASYKVMMRAQVRNDVVYIRTVR